MSGPSPAKREKKYHPVYQHATKPHGILLIMGLVFAITWAFWTFFLATPVVAP